MLRQHLADQVSLDVGQPPLDAVVVEGQLLVIEPKQVQDGRIEIVQRVDVLDRLLPELVCDAVADAGYEIEVIAADGYSKTFTSAEVKRNNNMIIAFQRDGGPLPENQWPLRRVGPNLEKNQMVGQLATIKITIP